MQPLEDVLTESNGPRVAEADYFSRPPQRSYQIIAATISMLVAIAIGSSILVRHWNELPVAKYILKKHRLIFAIERRSCGNHHPVDLLLLAI